MYFSICGGSWNKSSVSFDYILLDDLILDHDLTSPLNALWFPSIQPRIWKFYGHLKLNLSWWDNCVMCMGGTDVLVRSKQEKLIQRRSPSEPAGRLEWCATSQGEQQPLKTGRSKKRILSESLQRNLMMPRVWSCGCNFRLLASEMRWYIFFFFF